MQGHIHKRVHAGKNGNQTTRWYVVVDIGEDGEGRRRQKWHGGFRTRRDAEVARAKLVDDFHTGSYVVPDRLTFGNWVRDSWLPMTEARVKPSTFHAYKRNLEVPRPAGDRLPPDPTTHAVDAERALRAAPV